MTLDGLLKSGKWNQEEPKHRKSRDIKRTREDKKVKAGSLEALYEDIGKDVFTNRVNLGISQVKLCELANISPLSLGCLERGERNVQVKTLYQLAEAMGLRVQIQLVPKDKGDK